MNTQHATRTFMPPFLVMDIYATLMVVAGIVAYNFAPATANATTAIIIPATAAAIIFACAAITLAGISKPRLGRAGATLGLVFTLLFAALFAFPAFQRTQALNRYEPALAEFQAAVAAQTVEDSPEAREAFLDERRAPSHDITYLVVTLWSLSALSVVVFVILLTVRPKAHTAASLPSTP